MANTWLNNRKRRPTHPGEILREDILPAAGTQISWRVCSESHDERLARFYMSAAP